MEFIFTAVVEHDPDGEWLVSFPDVPEALTSGSDREEALANAPDALGMALRGYAARGLALPRPSAAPGENRVEVSIDVTDALKLAVIEAFRSERITKAELARRLGKAENEVRRILDPDHQTKAGALEEALAILGKRVVVSVLDAA